MLSSRSSCISHVAVKRSRYTQKLLFCSVDICVFISSSVCDMFDPDTLCFLYLQPALDYRGLAVTGMRRMTQAGDDQLGLCYSEGFLYVVEGQKELGRDIYSHSLAVYNVPSGSGHITRLDTLTGLGPGYWLFLCPRMDRHSQRVFIPCPSSGVTIARLDSERLVRERTLTCVHAIIVDAMSPSTVYVGDRNSRSVHVVDIRDDRITATLEKPNTVRRGEEPYSLTVLGDSVMVCYGGGTLVVYRHGSSAPVRVIPHPGGIEGVSVVSTDCRSNYIVTNYETKSVFIIDSNGDLHHTVNISDTHSNTDSDFGSLTVDCAVVNRQLWVGCLNGNIVIMSSQ